MERFCNHCSYTGMLIGNRYKAPQEKRGINMYVKVLNTQMNILHLILDQDFWLSAFYETSKGCCETVSLRSTLFMCILTLLSCIAALKVVICKKKKPIITSSDILIV